MRQKTFAPLSVIAVVVAFAICNMGAVKAEAAPIRVLFIGNSYTAFNDMPVMVAQMGSSLGHNIIPEMRTVGGASLDDHRRSSETLSIIASQRWDVVVLQDHSISPSQRPEHVRRYALPDVRFLAQAIRSNHPQTKIIYYQTWGRRRGDELDCFRFPRICSYRSHVNALRTGYRMYRDATGGVIAPVGDVWDRVVRDSARRRPFNARSLWLNDGSHPSRIGSYLAAATILRAIISAPVSPAEFESDLPSNVASYIRRMVDTQQ